MDKILFAALLFLTLNILKVQNYQLKINSLTHLHQSGQLQITADIHEKKTTSALPDGFVYLSDIDPTIVQNLRYLTEQNFVGEVIDGYYANKAIMTRQAALALSRVQKKLNKDGYKIVVYDSYRPQKAVNHFIRWAADPEAIRQKAKYYPYQGKQTLFDKGYIAKRSGHTRGSTLDMSIIKISANIKPIDYKLRTLKNSQLVMILDDGTQDFGVSFDYFGEPSHPDSDSVDQEFIQRREYLINMMKSQRFYVTDTQWWHYTLQNEPFPNTYFDFDIV